MYRLYTEEALDLKRIEDSGQCFRWKEIEKGYFRIVARGRVLRIRALSEREFELDTSREEFERVWKDYLDLETSYDRIRGCILPTDEFMQAAAKYGQGIRILRQEPWEMLVTFIISQRKNIPAIKKAIETLCRCAGEPIGEGQGESLYAFPDPARLLAMSREGWKQCALGYREKYIRRLAEEFADGAVSMEELEAMEDEKLAARLQGFYGVGPKVADCVLLFGFHRLNAFPKDVWINRILEGKYPGGFPYEAYAPCNGVMQQYMFCYTLEMGRKV